MSSLQGSLYFWLLGVFWIGLVVAEAACPPDGCGPHGKCLAATTGSTSTYCQCDLGFDGSDCSMPIDICPNSVDEADISSSSCLNGGECVAQDAIDATTGQKELAWTCDCSNAAGEASTSVAGPRCEFPAKTSCVATAESAMSSYAYCVNSGRCFRMIKHGQEQAHPGCGDCPDFEGRHCQYKKGTAPAEELEFARQQVQDSDNDKGMSGLGTFFVILLCFMLGSFVGYVMYVNFSVKRSSSSSQATTTTKRPTVITTDGNSAETSSSNPEIAVNSASPSIYEEAMLEVTTSSTHNAAHDDDDDLRLQEEETPDDTTKKETLRDPSEPISPIV